MSDHEANAIYQMTIHTQYAISILHMYHWLLKKLYGLPRIWLMKLELIFTDLVPDIKNLL